MWTVVPITRGARAHRARGQNRAMPTLIGRDSAAAELRQLVDGLRAGEGRLALVAGEAGIGKTALAQELARYAGATGAAVAWGVGVDSVGVPAYWPWPDVIAALGAPPLPDASPGEDGWFAAGAAVVAALRSAATTEAPVVVVLDDLQWAGAGCVRILDLAARQLRRSPVLLLGTFRDDEVGPHHPLSTVVGTAEVVTLDGLGEADVTRMLRESIGERADAVAGGVTRRTGGNPFFVQQIARLLSSGDEARVPAAVGEAVNRRL